MPLEWRTIDRLPKGKEARSPTGRSSTCRTWHDNLTVVNSNLAYPHAIWVHPPFPTVGPWIEGASEKVVNLLCLALLSFCLSFNPHLPRTLDPQRTHVAQKRAFLASRRFSCFSRLAACMLLRCLFCSALVLFSCQDYRPLFCLIVASSF